MIGNRDGWATASLGELNQGRDNNFNLIRVLAAVAVALSHSYLITTGDPSARPMITETGFSIGYHSVNTFFVISGFLVTQSWRRSSSFISFATARGLRIYPGIVISTLFVTFVLGATMTALPAVEYLTSPATYAYLTITASLAEPSGTLPGLFLMTPQPVGALGFFTRPKTFAALAALAGIGLLILSLLPIAHDKTIVLGHFVRFGLCFGLGVVAYQYRAHIPIHWIGVVGLIAIARFAFGQAIYPFLLYATTAYATFWLAFVPDGTIRLFNKSGDYSYGIYIYAFPVQQTLISLVPDLTPIQMFGAVVTTTLPLAIMSWHLVESPALRWKRPLTNFIIKKASLNDRTPV